MGREEFLRELREALEGEVPEAVIRDNVDYYRSYLSQEMAKGRTVDEICEEIGGPRIVAQTIIDVGEAGGESGGSEAGNDGAGNPYTSARYDDGGQSDANSGRHNPFHIDMSKWYWRLLVTIVIIVIVFFCMSVFGRLFFVFMRIAGPIIMIILLLQIFKNMRR